MRITKRLLAVFVSLTMALQISIPSTSAMALEPGASGQVSAYAASASKQRATASQDPAGLGEGPSISESTSTDESTSEDSTSQEDPSDSAEEPSSEQPSNQESTADESAPAEEATVQVEAEPQPQAAVTYDVITVDDLIQKLSASGTTSAAATIATSADGKKAASINAADPAKTLIVLSHTEPSIYSEAEISLSNTGNGVDLTGTAQVGPGTSAATWSFNGLGSEDVPFAGSMTNKNFALAHTLFNGVNIGSDSPAYEITWKAAEGYCDPMLASLVSSASGSLSVKVHLRKNEEGSTSFDKATQSSLVGVAQGNLSLSAEYDVADKPTEIAISQNGDSGMLVNTVQSGTLTVSGFSDENKLSKVEVSSTVNTGSAGYLVGKVEESAGLKIGCSITAPEGSVSTTFSQSGNPGAGGIVGRAEGASVTVGSALDVSRLSVNGYSAGGFSGRADNMTLTFEGDGSIAPAKTVGSQDATTAGGLFGEVSFEQEISFDASNLKLDNGDGYKVKAKQYVGGLFGVLGYPKSSIAGSPLVGISGLSVKSSQWEATYASGGSGSGGLVGSLSWPGVSGKLSITNTQVDYSCEQGTHLGGIVGTFWGPGLLVVDSTTVKAVLPAKNSISSEAGGVVGFSQDSQMSEVVVKDFAFSTEGQNALTKGGGVFGNAKQGVALKLQGTTNLSAVKYDSSSGVGQIVGSRGNALVFASGNGNEGSSWVFKRGTSSDGNAAAEVDDIGDYGEVVRLGGKLGSGFINLDEQTGTLTVNGGNRLSKTSGAFELSSEEQFALLALDWQTQHIFNLTYSSVADIAASDIKLNNDINLSGTGITGLSRDTSSEDYSYAGSFEGNGKTITLAIGEAYGVASNSSGEGDGKSYRHDALGLFAKAHGKVSGLKLAGSIRFKVKSNKEVAAGAYAATCDGDTNFSGVDFHSDITFSKDDDVSLNSFVGGAVGRLKSADSAGLGVESQVSFTGNSTLSGKIEVRDNANNRTFTGGAIGYIHDASRPTIAVDGLSISSSITALTANDSLPVGGFIGLIDQSSGGNSNIKKIQISQLSLNGMKLSLKSNNSVGGFLGYSWGQTEVSFAGDGSFALNASGAELDANNAKSVGGLVNHAGGKWSIGDKAISLDGSTIKNVSGERFGLLVCRGGKGDETGAIESRKLSSLYLLCSANWQDAYSPNATLTDVSADNFDEWVADTCEAGSSQDVFRSGVNGVVSLHTAGDAKNALNMEGSTSGRNSYVNRSDFGKGKQTNQLSRYYYNLDEIEKALDDGSCVDGVDSSEKLLLWSVYNYADTSIRDAYFSKGKCDSNTITGNLDMKGYSYYPIDLYDKSVTINDASVTFYNDKIEASEDGNKLTSGDTQHKGMHCALFRNASVSNSNNGLYVSNVQFNGAGGKLDGGSGLLLCGTANGFLTGLTANIFTVNINGCTLNGATINGFKSSDGYAPLLLNATSTATSLTVKGISLGDSYEGGKQVATSLIGNAGSTDASRISVVFSDIALPSKPNESVFSKATLLNSFAYRESGAATYNFAEAETNVTYGREIDDDGTLGRQSEYYGQQLWYYDVNHDDTGTRVCDGNVTADRNNFKGYLPYVFEPYNGTGNHEIAVNHEVVPIVDGCGTYGHPYEIKNAKELQKVADIIDGKEQSNNMQVRIVKDQESLCTANDDGSGSGSNDIVVTLSSDGWESLDGTTKLSNVAVQRYFQSAYYRISEPIEVTDFAGLGVSADNAFRGVIVGSDQGSITLDHENGSMMGLIKYSYGSVVKDLKINYKGESVSLDAPLAGRVRDNVPQVFFGGVIGCVLGGDNIIDGVDISAENGFNSASSDKVVPVGGYVGVVSGGGVIFRNTSPTSWHSRSAKDHYYDNPFLGRMLDGYAFGEDCEPNNGDVDSNYKINKIDSNEGSSVQTDLTFHKKESSATGGYAEYKANVEVKSAQGLLILSGIINSGAASGPANAHDNDRARGSAAYLGGTESFGSYKFGNAKYGKVRNASYDHIGGSAQDAQADFAISAKDDMFAPGLAELTGGMADGFVNAVLDDSTNAPYLVAKYANKATAFICANTSSVSVYNTFSFAEGEEINVSPFGSGYIGLSARYVSSAALGANGKKCATAVNPYVLAIDGKGATLSIYKDEKQYVDDDYCALGAGGLFPTVDFALPKDGNGPTELIKDLNITNSTIHLSYYDGTVDRATFRGSSTTGSGSANRLRSIVGVGGVAGVFAPYSSNSYPGGVLSGIKVVNTEVDSPVSGGSIFGMAGYAELDSSINNSYFAKVGSDHCMKIEVKDSSYSELNVSAGTFAGGFFGFLCTNGGTGSVNDSGSGLFESKGNALTVGKDSTIVGRDESVNIDWGTAWKDTSLAGGYAGQVKGYFNADAKDGGSLTFENVSVRSNAKNSLTASGGLIGFYQDPRDANVKNVNIVFDGSKDSEGNDRTIGASASQNAGGLIGRIGGSNTGVSIKIESCRLRGATLESANYAGGFIGLSDNNSDISIDKAKVENSNFVSSRSGGLIGSTGSVSTNVSISNAELAENILKRELSGALIGATASKHSWSNILLNENTYEKKAQQGVMVGDIGSACPGVYAAGMEIKIEGDKSVSDSLPDIDFNSDSSAVISSMKKKSYIAYANYRGASWSEEDKSKSLFGGVAVDPYVTTAPVSTVKVGDSYLYADGMSPQLANPAEGSDSIYSDFDALKTGKYLYSNVAEKGSRSIASSNISTLAAENNKANQTFDPDVLLVSSGQDGVIEEYLDTITNGAFSKARGLSGNGSFVFAETTTYSFNYDTGVLSVPESDSQAAKVRKAVEVRGSGSNLSFAITPGYDNTLDRLTLLKVSFKTADDNQVYSVYVPIVVRRMVQIDFTATMVEGTDFNKADYSALGSNAHVLAAYGDTVTALLTYTYNNELGDYKEYDWNGHLSAGGNMGPVDKTIKFGSSSGSQGNYPAGTQLTLVDCQNGNKMYKYEVPEGESASSLSLSEFKDSSGAPYEPAWMSDLMGVSAKLSTSGAWVECDKANATVSGKCEGETKYFRVVNAETDKDPSKYYELSVDDAQKAPSENFYLVVRFPESSTGLGLNGYLDSSVTLAVPSRINNKLRPSNEKDSQSNTASTYNILTGYGQELKDNVPEGVTTLQQNTSDYSFSMNVTDTISFAAGQLSNDNDKLYYQLGASLGLMSYSSSGGETLQSATGFPSGTTGKVEFRVHDDSGNYFKWGVASDGSHSWIPTEKDGVAVSYSWESGGNDMKLTLGTSSSPQDAVSLHSLRNGHNSITIDAVMEVHMTDEAHAAGIAAALAPDQGKDRPDSYTKLLYRGVLTTNSSRFDSSNTVASITGNHGYYRNESGSSSISFIASKPSQLGINLDDLASADGTIAAVGTYDLSKLNGSAALIEKAAKVEYKLSLQKREGTNDDGSGKYEDVNIGDYVAVTSAGSEGGNGSLVLSNMGGDASSYTWTDEKKDGKFATLDGDSRQFKLGLDMKVDTTKDAHTYANYRLILEAKLIDSDGKVLNSPTNTSDYITYTLTRVNTKGIHE